MNNIPYINIYRSPSESYSEVSNRTGLFTLNIPFIRTNANKGMGPELNVELRYSSLHSSRSPYGYKFYDTLSKFSKRQHKIYLSTGEIFDVDFVLNSHISFKNPQPSGYKIKLVGDIITLTHKNGTVEQFTSVAFGYDISCVNKIISPEGYSVNIFWQYYGAHPYIFKIADEYGDIINTIYSEGKVTAVIDQQEIAYKSLRYKNNRLFKILSSLTPGRPWIFKYDSQFNNEKKYIYLSKYISPVGIHTEIEMHFPGSMLPRIPSDYSLQDENTRDMLYDISNMPVVKRIKECQYNESSSAQQTPVHTDLKIFEYSYSNNNFLGYSAALDLSPNSEDLATEAIGDYEYTVTICTSFFRRDGAELQLLYGNRNEYKYNKFHLLIKNTLDFIDFQDKYNFDFDNYVTFSREIKVYNYPIDLTIPLVEQTPYYSLPNQIDATWEKIESYVVINQLSETTSTTYDDFCNITKKVNADGTIENYTYYPVEGEENLCPPDPNGFVNHLKKSNYYSELPGDGDKKFINIDEIEYVYSEYESRQVQQNTIYKTILLTEIIEGAYDSGIKLYTRRILNEYDADEPTSPFYISLKSKKEQIPSKPCKWETFSENTYDKNLSVDLSEVTITTNIITYDDIQLSYSVTMNASAQKILKEVDVDSNIIEYYYTPENHLMRRTLNPSTDYENTINFTYEFGTDSEESEIPYGHSRITATDQFGNMKRETYDGYECPVLTEYSKATTDSESIFFKINERLYTSGLLYQSRDYDYSPDSVEPLYIIDAYYHYGDWGEVSKIISSSGVTQIIDSNKSTRITRVYNEQNSFSEWSYDNPVMSGIISTEKDINGNVISEIKLSSNNEIISKKEYAYDYRNRLKVFTDEKSFVTQYFWDNFDRLIKIILPNHNEIHYKYLRLHIEPTEISLKENENSNEQILAERVIDGLARTTKYISGGRQYTYEYRNEVSIYSPFSEITPKGDFLQFSYDRFLEDKLTSVTGIEQNNAVVEYKKFTYDKKSGTLLETIDTLSDISESYEYNSQNQLIKMIVQDNENYIQNTFINSYKGMSLNTIFYNYGLRRISRSIKFDSRGRVNVFGDDNASANVIFDEINRPKNLNISIQRTSTEVDTYIHSYTYDDFNNLTKLAIDIANSGSETSTENITLNYSYDVMNRVEYYSSASTLNVLDNTAYTYGYDSVGRISGFADYDLTEPSTTLYIYDMYNNISESQTYSSSSVEMTNQIKYTFSGDDPTQLKNVKTFDVTGNIVSDITLSYDANGCFINEDQNPSVIIDYDIFQRLSKIDDVTLKYDANDNLRLRDSSANGYFYNYTNSILTDFISLRSDYISSYFMIGTAPQSLYSQTNAEPYQFENTFVGDRANTVITVMDNSIPSDYQQLKYDAWGNITFGKKIIL